MAWRVLSSSERRSIAIASPSGARPQRLLLQLGLLHQPVHQTAQQQALRPAALEAARPQPGVVGQQLGDPPLADPLQHQERPLGDAAHQHLDAGDLDVDLAEPAPPGRLVAVRLVPRRPAQVSSSPPVTGWRWPVSVSAGVKPRSYTTPDGRPGRTRASGVRYRLSGSANSGPAASRSAPPSST